MDSWYVLVIWSDGELPQVLPRVYSFDEVKEQEKLIERLMPATKWMFQQIEMPCFQVKNTGGESQGVSVG